MSFYTSPFFWALVSMFGLYGATIAVSGHRVGRSLGYVAAALTLVTTGRLVLVLPFCAQPRLGPSPWHRIVGGVVILVAFAVAAPALTVKWWRPPEAGMKLHTTGIYAIVRHPIYLSEVLWPVGWSLIWGSVVGLALTPLWWLAFLLHALVEERRLRRVLGDEYRAYARKVRGRIFPGVPM